MEWLGVTVFEEDELWKSNRASWEKRIIGKNNSKINKLKITKKINNIFHQQYFSSSNGK